MVVRLSDCSTFICFSLWQFICLPIWLLVSGSGCLQFICLPLWQLICFPVWLVVSGLSAVSNSFVSPYTDSFVSQSGWWCPALAVSNSCVSPCGNPFVSQSGWWCSALCVSRSPCGWWCPALAMSKLFASRLWQLICLPVWLVASGFLPVSIQLGWWCPGLRLSPIHLFPLVAMHLSPSLASGVRLLGCLQFIFVSQYNDSFVSQSGWWCPALRLSPIHVSSLVAIDLFPSLAGGVWLLACLQFICLPPLWQFIGLPIWLVVSGSSPVSNSLSSLVAIDLSPSLAGGVRLSGCLQVICFPLWQFICF